LIAPDIVREASGLMPSTAATIDSRKAWIMASAALAILTIAHGAPMISAVALKPIAAEFGLSRGAPAAAGSFAYIGAAVGGILAGALAGRFGFRPMVLFGGVMVALGLAVSSLGGLTNIYLGHGVLIGLFGTSCMLSPLITYVSLWFERRRGAAVALISAGQSIAGMVWPLLFDLGITRYGWRVTMEIYAVFAVVAIALLASVFLQEPPKAAPRRAAMMARTDNLALSPKLMMVLLMLAVFCCCVPMNMPMQHIVALCGDLGIGSRQGAAMLSLLLGSAFAARQLWGWVADKVGGLQTLVWSSLVQALALSAFLLTQDEWKLFAISSVFGLGLSGLLPAYVITVREYYPASEANWRVPTVLFAGYLGMAIGGWGAGALYDHFGYYAPAFAAGILFNLMNLLVLGWLASQQLRGGADPEAMTA
jgi:MFS family permease